MNTKEAKKITRERKRLNGKNNGKYPLHGKPSCNKLDFVIQGLHNFLSSRGIAVKGTQASDPYSLDMRSRLLNDQESADYSAFKRGFVSNVFGTQFVRMKLRSAPASITTSVGGILTSVVFMTYTGLSNNADLTNVFDEVRFLAPMEFTYYPELSPNATTTTRNLGIAAIDYDDSSALSSVNQALSYDTAKIVQLAPVCDTADAYKTAIQWHGKLIGQPDQVWNTTTGYSTAVAYLKFYNLTGSLTSSTTYGYVIYTNELEFRQAN